MPKNKIVYGNQTLIDLTADTVTPETMLNGTTAHDRSGAAITGTLVGVPASTTIPAMNGTASAGVENAYSRGDHVHPSDATKLDKLAEPTLLNEIPVIESGGTLYPGGKSLDSLCDITAWVSTNVGFNIVIQKGEDASDVPTALTLVSGTDNITFLAERDGESYTMDAATPEYVDSRAAALQTQIDALGEPFRVKNWAGSNLNVQIPCCTEDIGNTSIPKMTFTITGQEAVDYQAVGMIAYEVKDTSGQRLNCWPVCQFTGNGQTELSVRWMCGGTTRKTAASINAWVLLKHR